MTRYLVLLGGLHCRLLLAFHGRSGPPVDEPLRRGTASALQAGEERCGDQLIQEIVNRQVGGERRIWGAIRLILGGVMFHGRAEDEGDGGLLDRSAEEGESHEEPLRLGAEKGQELGQKNIIRGERDRLGDRYVQIPRSVDPAGHVHAVGQSPLQPLPQLLRDARQPPPAVPEQGVEHFQRPWVSADARPQHVQLIVVERFHVGEVPGQAQGLTEGQRAQSPPSQILAAVIGQFEAVPAGDEQRGRTGRLRHRGEEIGQLPVLDPAPPMAPRVIAAEIVFIPVRRRQIVLEIVENDNNRNPLEELPSQEADPRVPVDAGVSEEFKFPQETGVGQLSLGIGVDSKLGNDSLQDLLGGHRARQRHEDDPVPLLADPPQDLIGQARLADPTNAVQDHAPAILVGQEPGDLQLLASASHEGPGAERGKITHLERYGRGLVPARPGGRGIEERLPGWCGLNGHHRPSAQHLLAPIPAALTVLARPQDLPPGGCQGGCRIGLLRRLGQFGVDPGEDQGRVAVRHGGLRADDSRGSRGDELVRDRGQAAGRVRHIRVAGGQADDRRHLSGRYRLLNQSPGIHKTRPAVLILQDQTPRAPVAGDVQHVHIPRAEGLLDLRRRGERDDPHLRAPGSCLADGGHNIAQLGLVIELGLAVERRGNGDDDPQRPFHAPGRRARHRQPVENDQRMEGQRAVESRMAQPLPRQSTQFLGALGEIDGELHGDRLAPSLREDPREGLPDGAGEEHLTHNGADLLQGVEQGRRLADPPAGGPRSAAPGLDQTPARQAKALGGREQSTAGAAARLDDSGVEFLAHQAHRLPRRAQNDVNGLRRRRGRGQERADHGAAELLDRTAAHHPHDALAPPVGRIVTARHEPDNGTVLIPDDRRAGHIAQHARGLDLEQAHRVLIQPPFIPATRGAGCDQSRILPGIGELGRTRDDHNLLRLDVLRVRQPGRRGVPRLGVDLHQGEVDHRVGAPHPALNHGPGLRQAALEPQRHRPLVGPVRGGGECPLGGDGCGDDIGPGGLRDVRRGEHPARSDQPTGAHRRTAAVEHLADETRARGLG